MARRTFELSPLLAAVLIAAPLLGGCAFLSPPDELRRVAHEPPPEVVSAPAGPLEAGAAKVDLTPAGSVEMAGFSFLKDSEGVHDPLMARALALRRGEVTVVLVGVDLIGLHHYQVEAIRRRLRRRVAPCAVLVAATHTHSGPDTLGLWGFPPFVSGLDEDYVSRVLSGVTEAAEQALAALAPARLRIAQAQAPAEGISRNRRHPDTIDRTLTVLGFDRPDGAPIATLVHYACHPEGLGKDNLLLSADFCAALYRDLEAARPGSVAVFLNGALGGMVTTDEAEDGFPEVERIGSALAALALGALGDAEPLPAEVALAAGRREVAMPVQNRRYLLAELFGLLGPRPFFDGYTPTEVQAIKLGPAVLVTLPGEPVPALGFALQELIAGEPRLVIGLGNDELGYLIPTELWADPRLHYERTMSPGSLAAPLLLRTARRLLRDLDALAPPP